MTYPEPVTTPLCTLLLPLVPLLQDGSDTEPATAGPASPDEASAKKEPGPLVVRYGDSQVELRIPRDEQLVFDVYVDFGLLDAPMGKVTMSAGVEPFRKSSVLLRKPGEADEVSEQGWMSTRATGDHFLYTLDSKLESRHLPQDYPRAMYKTTQKGSENRRTELMLGHEDGKHVGRYRKDTDQGAPKGERIWRPYQVRELPEDVFDMISSIYTIRTMLEDGKKTQTILVADKDRLWRATFTAGKKGVKKTKAGEFDAVRISATIERAEGEPPSDKQPRGLFGMQGSIGFWVDPETGVPILIEGTVPAGILDLGVEIKLKSYSGTPASFQPHDKE